MKKNLIPYINYMRWDRVHMFVKDQKFSFGHKFEILLRQLSMNL